MLTTLGQLLSSYDYFPYFWSDKIVSTKQSFTNERNISTYVSNHD